MVERAKENAARRGVQFEGIVQEISKLRCHFKFLSCGLAFKGDVLMCTDTRPTCGDGTANREQLETWWFLPLSIPLGSKISALRERSIYTPFIAACTLGNTAYEEGDILWGNIEFIHIIHLRG